MLGHLGLFMTENSIEKWALQLWLVAEHLPFAEQVPGSLGYFAATSDVAIKQGESVRIPFK